MGQLAQTERAEAFSSKILNVDGSQVQFAGGGLNFHGREYMEGFGKPLDQPLHEYEELLFGCGAALWVKKEVFEAVGGLDPDFFAYHEDVDLGWRMRLLGYRTIYVPQAPVRHVHQGTYKHLTSEIYYHCERNAVITLIKNLSEENLYKILSASLVHAESFSCEWLPTSNPSLRFSDTSSKPERKEYFGDLVRNCISPSKIV